MTENIEDRLDEQAARVRRTYQDHIAADVMALAADCLRAAAETISRLEADEQEAEHVMADVERLTAENQELREQVERYRIERDIFRDGEATDG